jgi:lipopolysaccharide transport system ATP-binding protein
MTEIAISVESLTKRYRIGVRRDPYGRLTESLWDGLAASFRGRGGSDDDADFWALKDVSFELPRGSSLGVIGKNGAGKSTLLKILSRITEPTSGRARLYGRVASLLEVGTGFHNELTGRENVYLSGAILGMRRGEIARRFDEIVDFADVGPFLETPVKRYSSGMKVRLGFAVAAFLEAEILIVDEVLAVGDAEFQRKSLGKMTEIEALGRTVIFVSHNVAAVSRLCERVILLEHGRVAADGPTQASILRYLRSDTSRLTERVWEEANAPGDAVAKLRSLRVVPVGGGRGDEIDISVPIDIEVEYQTQQPEGARPSVSLHFVNEEGVLLFAVNDWSDRGWWESRRRPGIVRAICRIPGNFFAEGRVSVTAMVGTYTPPTTHAIEQNAVGFLIVDRTTGDGVRGIFPDAWPGVVRPMLEWHVSQVENLPLSRP